MNTVFESSIKCTKNKHAEWIKYVYTLVKDKSCSTDAKKEFVNGGGLDKLIKIMRDTQQPIEIKRMGCELILFMSEDPLYSTKVCESGGHVALLCVFEYFRGEETVWKALALLSKARPTSAQNDDTCMKKLLSAGVVQASLRILTIYGISGVCIRAALQILLEISSCDEGVACIMENDGSRVIRDVEKNLYLIVRPGYGEIRYSEHYYEVLHTVRILLSNLGMAIKHYDLSRRPVEDHSCCSVS